MELSSIEHISPADLCDIKADLFITSLSHEERACNIARATEALQCRKIALVKSNPHQELAYKNNREYLLESGFEFLKVADAGLNFNSLLEQEDHEKKLNILIDCTSMPQTWYYGILNWFAENDELSGACLRFTYTMAGFVEQEQALKVKGVKDFIRVGAPRRKERSALILGLGQEARVSEDILKRLSPDLLYLFYADPAVEKRFVEQLFVNNHAIIEQTPIRNLMAYPIHNAQNIYQILSDTVLPLRDEYSITIIPQGPKIFSLVSMLIQLGYPEINLSYPEFKRHGIHDRKSSGDPVIIDLCFEGDE